jgi:hypothetical protein
VSRQDKHNHIVVPQLADGNVLVVQRALDRALASYSCGLVDSSGWWTLSCAALTHDIAQKEQMLLFVSSLWFLVCGVSMCHSARYGNRRT